MTKVKRKIIEIDEDKCNGCGLCIPACPEGALQIIDGKARLVKEQFCDGLGACLGDCPEDALHIVEREVELYNADGVIEHIKKHSPDQLEKHFQHMNEHESEIKQITRPAVKAAPCACPGSKMMQWANEDSGYEKAPRLKSRLRQWPFQLHLVPPGAPYFEDADLMIIADCVPFTYPNFHEDFVKDKAIAIGCPKLDDADAYIDKITQIIKISKPKSITVVYMEVPCCTGLVHITGAALDRSGLNIPFETIRISIRGDVLETQKVQLKTA